MSRWRGTRIAVPAGRRLLGLEQYDQANEEFRIAMAQPDSNATYRVRWGTLLHERFNNTDAEDLFKEALQRTRRMRRPIWDWRSSARTALTTRRRSMSAKALSSIPSWWKRTSCWRTCSRRCGHRHSVKEADAALKLSPDALDAMAIHAAVELLADRSPDAWLAKIR